MDETQTFDGQSLASRLAEEWREMSEVEEFSDEEIQVQQVTEQESSPPLETAEEMPASDELPAVPEDSPESQPASTDAVDQPGELDANQSGDVEPSGDDLSVVSADSPEPLDLPAGDDPSPEVDEQPAQTAGIEMESSEQTPMELTAPAESVDAPVAELDPAGAEPEPLQPGEQPESAEPVGQLNLDSIDTAEQQDARIELPPATDDPMDLGISASDSGSIEGDRSVPGEVESSSGPEVDIVSRDLPDSGDTPLPIQTASAASDPGLEMADEPNGWSTDSEPALAMLPSPPADSGQSESQPSQVNMDLPAGFHEEISAQMQSHYRALQDAVTQRLVESVDDQTVYASLSTIPE